MPYTYSMYFIMYIPHKEVRRPAFFTSSSTSIVIQMLISKRSSLQDRPMVVPRTGAGRMLKSGLEKSYRCSYSVLNML